MGLSITQDPAFLNWKPESYRNQAKINRLDKKHNVRGQAAFDEQYQKPMKEKSPEHLDKLFLKGVTTKAPSRVLANKNYSELVNIMNEENKGLEQVYEDMYKGKKSLPASNKSITNLISGNYGMDPYNRVEMQMKPYSRAFRGRRPSDIEK